MSLADELLADLDDTEAVEDEEDPFASAKAGLVDASIVDNGSSNDDVEMSEKPGTSSSAPDVPVPEHLVGPLKPTHLLSAPMVNAPISAFAKLRNSEKVSSPLYSSNNVLANRRHEPNRHLFTKRKTRKSFRSS